MAKVKFTTELKKRGAYLYGSRALGVASDSSDWDWALLNTPSNVQFVRQHGFRKETRSSYNRKIRGRVPITQLAGFEAETMQSYRKGKTNVILMTPKLFAANKYATDMLRACDGTGLCRTKEGRVQGYQKYGMEYVAMTKMGDDKPTAPQKAQSFTETPKDSTIYRKNWGSKARALGFRSKELAQRAIIRMGLVDKAIPYSIRGTLDLWGIKTPGDLWLCRVIPSIPEAA